MKMILIKILNYFGLRKIVKAKFKLIEFIVLQQYERLFNETVIKQNKDYKSIPIIIISFNQLFYLKHLIEFLRKHNYNNIVIIDNNSTYKPLLEYFKEVESFVILHRLKENYGHLVFWKNKTLFDKYSKGYYVVTDADINPVLECPQDFLLYFKKVLDKNISITKAGFSLKMDEIPDTNLNKEKIVKWESKFWIEKDKDGNFISDLDTTFALYRPNYDRKDDNFYKARRTKFPYTAEHGGWYIDNDNLTEEQKFFFANCNESSSWRINEEGNISKKIYLK